MFAPPKKKKKERPEWIGCNAVTRKVGRRKNEQILKEIANIVVSNIII